MAESEVLVMNVLLLEHPRNISPERCNDIANTPLSSSLITGSIAGLLTREGHQVHMVEGYLDRLSYGEIQDELEKIRPEILGIHMVYGWENNRELFAFLETLRSQGLGPLIVVYGFYPTFAYAEIFRDCPAIDAVLVGEPELTFSELAAGGWQHFRSGEVPGMAWRDDSGKPQMLRRRILANLDSLPYPLRSPAMLRMQEVNIEGSRGCYGGCTFCYINPYYGQCSRWRGRSPENICREIDQVMEIWGKKEFYFTDPNFFGPGQRGQERAIAIARLLNPKNIRFGIEARVNDIHEDSFSALVDAGLRDILIGLESGRNESLQRLNKMTTVAQNEEALKIIRRSGIEPNVGFIMFEPDASLEDIRINFDFLYRNDLLKELSITANVLYHPQIILQGTTAYRKMQEEGRLVLAATTYEGSASFNDPKVGMLANLTGRITNHLFIKMDRIWSGQVEETAAIREKYRALNRILIKYFTDALEVLQSDQSFALTDMEEMVSQAKEEINFLAP
ncbi:MAG: radical SAM protein [Dehalobacterium sp.]